MGSGMPPATVIRSCETCGKAFPIAKRLARQPRRGRFCGHKCRAKNPSLARHLVTGSAPVELADYFWQRVGFGMPDECWEWTSNRTKLGYARIRDRRTGHRVAWTLTFGAIPRGMCVLHRCDNPPCCNPNHLFLGTVLDNNRDRHRKDRSRGPQGEQNAAAKLTPADVLAIRASTGTHQEVAIRFNLFRGTVAKIRRRELWAHLL